MPMPSLCSRKLEGKNFHSYISVKIMCVETDREAPEFLHAVLWGGGGMYCEKYSTYFHLTLPPSLPPSPARGGRWPCISLPPGEVKDMLAVGGGKKLPCLLPHAGRCSSRHETGSRTPGWSHVHSKSLSQFLNCCTDCVHGDDCHGFESHPGSVVQ